MGPGQQRRARKGEEFDAKILDGPRTTVTFSDGSSIGLPPELADLLIKQETAAREASERRCVKCGDPILDRDKIPASWDPQWEHHLARMVRLDEPEPRTVYEVHAGCLNYETQGIEWAFA